MPSAHTFSHRRDQTPKRFGASEAPQHLRRGRMPERCVCHARGADANRRGDRDGLHHRSSGSQLVRLSSQCSTLCSSMRRPIGRGSRRFSPGAKSTPMIGPAQGPTSLTRARTAIHLRDSDPTTPLTLRRHYITTSRPRPRTPEPCQPAEPSAGKPGGQPFREPPGNETPRWDNHGMGGEGSIEQLLTIREAAEVLRTTPRFPRRLIAERRIRFVKVGRHVRIPESALVEFVAAGVVEPVIRHARRLVV